MLKDLQASGTVATFVQEVWARGPTVVYHHERRWEWWHRNFCADCKLAVEKFCIEIAKFFSTLVYQPLMPAEEAAKWVTDEVAALSTPAGVPKVERVTKRVRSRSDANSFRPEGATCDHHFCTEGLNGCKAGLTLHRSVVCCECKQAYCEYSVEHNVFDYEAEMEADNKREKDLKDSNAAARECDTTNPHPIHLWRQGIIYFRCVGRL